MILQVNPAKLSGTIAVPGSKSHTIRAIVAGMMADGCSIVRAPLMSADTISALNAAKLLGTKVEILDGMWKLTGNGGKLSNPNMVLDLGNSGTGLRLLSAAAATANFKVEFDGDESLRTRPMRQLAESLRTLGATVIGDKCPISLQGPLIGGKASVNAVSSQFLTALLFALPLAKNDSQLTVPLLNEAPYIAITLAWLEKCGIKYTSKSDYSEFTIPGRQTFRAFDTVIPADFSTASFPLAAAMVAGGEIEIANLDFSDVQGDKLVFDFFEQMGATISRDVNSAIVRNSDNFTGREIDMNSTPDALPAMAVAACFAKGTTVLKNVPQARIKETDRIACMTSELTKMGAKIEELPDGMVIHNSKLHGANVESFNDHRIAMSLAIAACGADSTTYINNMEAAAVTYPNFIDDFKRIGADFTPKGV